MDIAILIIGIIGIFFCIYCVKHPDDDKDRFYAIFGLLGSSFMLILSFYLITADYDLLWYDETGENMFKSLTFILSFLICILILIFILILIHQKKVQKQQNDYLVKETKDLSKKLQSERYLRLENEKTVNKLNRKIKDLENELDNYTKIIEDSQKLNKEETDETFDFNEKEISLEKIRLIKRMIESNDNFFITGKAGTGKSYLLRYFYKNAKKRTLLCAPTGIAALNIEGVTLHSAFGFLNLGTDAEIRLSANQKSLFTNINTIVIDEISMVRVDVFSQINSILQLANGNDKPFGGKQLIIIGDLFQLPPVASKEETQMLTDKYGGIFFFNSPAYKQAEFHFYELTEVYRQNKETEKEFLSVLNRIREGTVSDTDIEYLNKRYKPDPPRRIVRIVPTRNVAGNINEQQLAEIKSAKEFSYSSFIEVKNGEKTPNETEFPCTLDLRLKVGALVMMIKNDTANGCWVNGTMGIVSYLSDDTVKITINGTEYEISKSVFSKQRCIYDQNEKKLKYIETARVVQYPVVLAYAITIHKSQGKSYPQLACEIQESFEPGQAYVALSRCTSYNGLYLLSPITKKCIEANSVIQNFYNQQKQIEFKLN